MIKQDVKSYKIVLESEDIMYEKLLRIVSQDPWLRLIYDKLLHRAGEEITVEDTIKLVSRAIAELVAGVQPGVQMVTWLRAPDIFRAITPCNGDLLRIAEKMLEYKNTNF
ncbi:MAG: hypothetical protein WCP11_01285 [Candidatus Saccharibacteria bacterium]